MSNDIHIVFTPGDADGGDAPEAVAAFTTTEKAEEYIRAEFDPELEDEAKPYVETLEIDPSPTKKEFVTLWHTCIDIHTGEFGNKGARSRHTGNDAYARDREEIRTTPYNLGYANVYSRKSAADSICRAKALRERTLKEKEGQATPGVSDQCEATHSDHKGSGYGIDGKNDNQC